MARQQNRATRRAVDDETYDVTDQPKPPQQRQAGRKRSQRASSREGMSPRSPTRGPSGLPLLRTSERGTFKRCRWLYKLEYVDLLKPNVETPPLSFGSVVHKALARYYKPGIRRGTHPAVAFEEELWSEAVRISELIGARPAEVHEFWRDRAELGIAMLNNYVETYGKDDEWKVLATEIPFRVIINHPIRKTPWFWYTGILDNLLEHRKDKQLWIRDHKTTSAIQTKYLALDEQTTSYWTFGIRGLHEGRIIQPGQKVSGIEFNFLRKQKPPDKAFIVEDGVKYYTNLDGSVSKTQPAPFFHRHKVWRRQFEEQRVARRVVGEFSDMELMRRDLADGAEDEAAYKNPTKMTCPGCWAFDLCELHEAGGDWEHTRDLTTHTWDPYEAHEIYAGETR